MFKEMKLGHLKVNEDNLKLVLLGGRKAMKKLSEGGGNRTSAGRTSSLEIWTTIINAQPHFSREGVLTAAGRTPPCKTGQPDTPREKNSSFRG